MATGAVSPMEKLSRSCKEQQGRESLSNDLAGWCMPHLLKSKIGLPGGYMCAVDRDPVRTADYTLCFPSGLGGVGWGGCNSIRGLSLKVVARYQDVGVPRFGPTDDHLAKCTKC